MNEEDKQFSSEESDSSDDNILSESEESEDCVSCKSEESDREEYISDEDSEVETAERRPEKKISEKKKAGRNSNMNDKTCPLQELRIDMDYVLSSDEEFMSVQQKKDEDKSVVASCKSKKKSKRKNGRSSPKVSISEDEDDVNIDDTDWLSKKQRKKQQKAMLVSNTEEEKQSVKERRQRRQMERQIRDKDTIYDFSKIRDTDIHCWGYFCELCSAEFTTKNRLFEHLKKTGHAVYMPDKARNKKNNGEQTSKTKGNFYKRNN